MTAEQEIRQLLQAFQEGYTQRNLAQIDCFMELFTPQVEMIGTNGLRPGVNEWYTNRSTAQQLIAGDWQSWGDLRLDFETLSIQSYGEVGWIAALATVTQHIGSENYAWFLTYAKEFIETSPLPAEQKLNYLLRGGTNTLYELQRGETFIWPLRLTAVVAHQPEGWKFTQLHFSFPTTHFPDVRILDQEQP